MSSKATDKFCFRDVWYSTDLVRKAACKAYNLPEEDFKEDSRLQELVVAIMRGTPTKAASFIVALNEGVVK